MGNHHNIKKYQPWLSYPPVSVDIFIFSSSLYSAIPDRTGSFGLHLTIFLVCLTANIGHLSRQGKPLIKMNFPKNFEELKEAQNY